MAKYPFNNAYYEHIKDIAAIADVGEKQLRNRILNGQHPDYAVAEMLELKAQGMDGKSHPVYVDNQLFPSIQSAADFLNVSTTTIKRHLHSGRVLSKDLAHLHKRFPYNGVNYKHLTEVAKAAEVNYSSMQQVMSELNISHLDAIKLLKDRELNGGSSRKVTYHNVTYPSVRALSKHLCLPEEQVGKATIVTGILTDEDVERIRNRKQLKTRPVTAFGKSWPSINSVANHFKISGSKLREYLDNKMSPDEAISLLLNRKDKRNKHKAIMTPIAADEEWREVTKFPSGQLVSLTEPIFVSNYGRVSRKSKDNQMWLVDLNLNQTSGKKYYSVNLGYKSKTSKHTTNEKLHRLIYMVFHDNEPLPKKLVIHHISGDSLDNHLENLALVSHLENTHEPIVDARRTFELYNRIGFPDNMFESMIGELQNLLLNYDFPLEDSDD
ncbi:MULTISPECIES: HNH endonuclease signature motif containing protein [Weissella]|uniref:HNH endonuclease signature motif containing protein n=1 Tax=Weissella fermenti TaxID=2987699 RepID=A0ABT6D5K9_9LACO|nr:MULTISPECIES: HNH endonuclease signature motif containing protein [unclassified Weissella]MCW0925952.1 HNH endonuclease [Weissella sp. LMG 11983]MDF9300809.1 HNH endonuclease signature motif containing protein [Weissella sp. BK2]